MSILNKRKPRMVVLAAAIATLLTTSVVGPSAVAAETAPVEQAGQAPSLMVQTSDGVVTPTSVESCSTSSISGGTKYTGCKIYVWSGVWSMSFYADFTIKSSGYDSIDRVYNRAWSWGGPVSESSYTLSIGQKTESASGSAWARYTGTFTGALIGTRTQWVGLWVGGNTYGYNYG